ncbi:MAG: hypothetical protein CSA38_01975 [Flavobacteriales bacterium]|nr:MAG: hypothetical protein CSA38_01975 [Flavobacteriales bacterium]
MHSIEIKETGDRFWIPEHLGECSRKQYLDMAKLILTYQIKAISYETFRIMALYLLMNMEYKENNLEEIEEVKMQNVYITSEVLDSFFEEDENGKKHLIQDYVHNPVKFIKYKFGKFHGPEDAFKDITWKQLIEGLGEVQSFANDGDLKRLTRLFAMFYLRKGETLSDINLDKRVKYFKYLDIRYIYGFYLLFVSFWRFLTTNAVVEIDGKDIDLTLLFTRESKGEGESEYTELGLRSTSYQIAESGVFGTMKELNETNAWEILINMYDMMVRNEKRNAELEKTEE